MHSTVNTFKALADETRLRILMLLLDGELCVCEIIAALELPQSTISRHLAYLRKSNWVKDRRQGLWMYYRLNENEDVFMDELKIILNKHLAQTIEHSEALSKLRSFQTEQNQKVC